MRVHRLNDARLPLMGISTPVKPVTIEEFLSNPHYEHSEYVNGEVVPLNAGTNRIRKFK